MYTCRLQAKTVATAAAAVAGFNDNEIDLAFARYGANADGKRSQFRVFYRAMHFSAKRGIAIVILSVRLSVYLSVCYVRAL